MDGASEAPSFTLCFAMRLAWLAENTDWDDASARCLGARRAVEVARHTLTISSLQLIDELSWTDHAAPIASSEVIFCRYRMSYLGLSHKQISGAELPPTVTERELDRQFHRARRIG